MTSSSPRHYYSEHSENSTLFYEPSHQSQQNSGQINQWEPQHQLLTPPFEESTVRQQGRFSTPPYVAEHYYQENIPRTFSHQQQQQQSPSHQQQHHHHQVHMSDQPQQQLRSPFPSPTTSPNPSPRLSSPSTPQHRHHSYAGQSSQHCFHSNDNVNSYYPSHDQISPSYPESPYEVNQPPREDCNSPEAVAYRIDRPDTPCKPFIAKLSHLLGHPELYSDIVHWNTSGTSFVVAITERFIKVILPEVFSHNSITAFRRQLNTYGFNHLSNAQLEESFLPFSDPSVSARDLGAWAHPFFSREDPSNLNKLTPRPSRARRQHQSYKLAMMLEGRTGISLRSKVEEKKRRLLSLSAIGSSSNSMAEEITECYLQTP